MINFDNAIQIISVKRTIDNNEQKYYFYLDGKLLFINGNNKLTSNKLEILFDVHLYDYVEDTDYVYSMIHYTISNNNFKYMESLHMNVKKLINNIEFSTNNDLSHNKVIDDYFKPFYFKIKRQNKINKLLNV
jgi:hypothetical protein